MIRGKWWEIYHDPKLNALEEQVNISNQNVAQAEAQFREAAATVKVARAAFFPTVTANPAFTLSQASQSLASGGGRSGSESVVTSGSGTGTGVAVGGTSPQHVGATVVDLYDLPVEASYMVDIWGAVRRNVESGAATAQASFANLENMRLSYQATLAQDYFSLQGLDAQEELLQDHHGRLSEISRPDDEPVQQRHRLPGDRRRGQNPARHHESATDRLSASSARNMKTPSRR